MNLFREIITHGIAFALGMAVAVYWLRNDIIEKNSLDKKDSDKLKKILGIENDD